MTYEIKIADPITEITTRHGKRVRLPFELHVNGKFLTACQNKYDAKLRIAAHRRKQAERRLEEIKIEKQLLYEY